MVGDAAANDSVLEKPITYEQHEAVKESIDDPDNEGQTKTITKTKQVKHTVPLRQFLETLKSSMAEHVQHMFRYRWQAAMLGDKLTMLQTPGHIAVAMDFAENYTILEQVESQSMHWDKAQLAILVFIVYSLAPTSSCHQDGAPRATTQSDSSRQGSADTPTDYSGQRSVAQAGGIAQDSDHTSNGAQPRDAQDGQPSIVTTSCASAGREPEGATQAPSSSAHTSNATDHTVVMEQFFFVSKLLKKGCEFVNTCILKLLDHLESEGRAVDMVHFISDGCAGDFKSNHAMLDRAMLWMMTTDKSKVVTCIVNFSESGHGKGPWDGAGAWLKNLLHLLATRQGIVLRDPEEIAAHINNNYSKPSDNHNRNRLLVRRHCFAVTEVEVDYAVTSRAKADLRDIRSMHQFDCPGGKYKGTNDLVVGYRELSCYCCACIDRDFAYCENKQVVGNMQRVQMRPSNEATALVIENYRDHSSLADMWEPQVNYGSIVVPALGDFPSPSDARGCWVAITHDDAEYSEYLYYVMWVNKGPVELKSPKRDGYGSHFNRGSRVCEGFYLELLTDDEGKQLPESDGRYTLNTTRAICDVKSVVYSGFGVEIIPHGNTVVYNIDSDTQREIRDRSHMVLV